MQHLHLMHIMPETLTQTVQQPTTSQPSEVERENMRLVFLNSQLIKEVASLKRQLASLREIVGFD